MSTFLSSLDAALGLGHDATELTFVQVSLRGVIVFLAAVAIIRCGDRHFLSQKTEFDAVVGFILAPMPARHQWHGRVSSDPRRGALSSCCCTVFSRTGRGARTSWAT
jgi:hypothetical protein